MSAQRNDDLGLVWNILDDIDGYVTKEERDEVNAMAEYLDRAIELTPEMRKRGEEIEMRIEKAALAEEEDGG